jgi:cell division protein FtsL
VSWLWVTDKFDSLCTEIKSSSKMVIKDQSKDPANVVQEIQNLNETISKQNMETMLWVTNLADNLSSSIPFILEVPINKIFGFVGSDCCFFWNKLQVMRSDYELEIAKLQSKLDTQSQLTSDAKQQLNHTTHILNFRKICLKMFKI